MSAEKGLPHFKSILLYILYPETFRVFFQVYVVGGLSSHKTSLKMMKADFKVEEKY